MKERINPLVDLEMLQINISCVIKMLDAVYDAAEKGIFESSEYMDAIYGISDYLFRLNGEMKECINVLFDERKAVKREVRA